MTKPRKIGALLALFLPSSIVLTIHAYLGHFSRFIADDFCSAYYAGRLGMLRSIWYWYRTWSGGYSTSIMDWMLVPIGTKGIPYVTPIVVVVWAAVTMLTIASLLPKDTRTKDKLWASLSLGTALIFVILLLSPNVPQSLYWWGGMRGYIPPIAGITLYIAIYQWFKRRVWGTKGLLFWSGVSFGIVFINGGFSETFTPLQLVLFVCAIGLVLLKGKVRFRDPEFYFLAAGLIGAAASLIAMVAAPGNANRQAYYPPSPDVFAILSIASTGYVDFLKNSFGAPENVAGLVGMVAGAAWLGMQLHDQEPPKAWIAPALLLTGFGLAFLCFPPAAFGLSDVPPDRTLIIPAFALVTCCMGAGFIGGNWAATRVKPESVKLLHLGLFVVVVGLIGFSAWSNARELYSTRQVYIDYAQKWDQVNTQIIQARVSGDESVTIPAMKNWADLNYPIDNPKFWLTECYTQFYRIQVFGPPNE